MTESTKRPAVLIISTARNGRGGIASVVDSYAAAGLSDFFELNYLVSHRDGSALTKIAVLVTALLKAPFYFLNPRYRVIHIHTASRVSFMRKSIFLWLARLFRKPTVLHIHSGEFIDFYLNESGKLKQAWIRKSLRAAGQLVVLSASWQQQIAKIVPEVQTSIVFNPYLAMGEMQAKSLQSDPPGIMFLGNLTEKKGFFDILQALAELKKRGNKFIFRFGGNGDLQDIGERISSFQLEDSVEHLGWVTGADKEKLFSQSQIFLLPSYHEGVPVSILEAMDHQVAVIASTAGGIPDIVEDQQTGLLLEAGNVVQLTAAISRLLESEELRQQLVTQAYQKLQKDFSLHTSVQQLRTVYMKLIEA